MSLACTSLSASSSASDGCAPAPTSWRRSATGSGSPSAAVIEELYAHQRDVTLNVLAAPATASTALSRRGANRAGRRLERSRALLTELEAAKEIDLSMLAVASRQFRALTES